MSSDSSRPRSILPYGGARNRLDRTSDALSERVCRNIIYSAVAAFVIGAEFNRFITIHWQKGGLSDNEAAKATGRFIKYCSDWMSNHAKPCTWLWVRENDGDRGRVGSHVHILLHVPTDLGPLFRKFPYRWVKLISNGKPMKGMLKSKTIRGYSSLVSAPDLYLASLDYHVHYILKAAPAEVAERLCLTLFERRGQVIGKRAAVCQLLLDRIKPRPQSFLNRAHLP